MKRVLLSLVALIMLSNLGVGFTEIESYQDLNKIQGLAYDGTYFYGTTISPNKIVKLDMNFNVIQEYPLTFSSKAMTFAQGYLWLVSSDKKKVYKFDTSGNNLGYFSTAKKSSGGYAYIYPETLTFNGERMLMYSEVQKLLYSVDLNCALTYRSAYNCNNFYESLYYPLKEVRGMSYVESNGYKYLIFGGKNTTTNEYGVFALDLTRPWINSTLNIIEFTPLTTTYTYTGGTWDGQYYYIRTNFKDCQGLTGTWFMYLGGCYGKTDATTCSSLGGQVKSPGICWKVPGYNNGRIYKLQPATFTAGGGET